MTTSGSSFAAGGALPALRVTVRARGPAMVLDVAGEIDVRTVGQLEQAITTALDNQPQTLVIDLTTVGFMGSAGLAALIAARHAAGDTIRFRVVADGNATLRPLRITGLDQEIAVFESLNAALTTP